MSRKHSDVLPSIDADGARKGGVASRGAPTDGAKKPASRTAAADAPPDASAPDEEDDDPSILEAEMRAEAGDALPDDADDADDGFGLDADDVDDESDDDDAPSPAALADGSPILRADGSGRHLPVPVESRLPSVREPGEDDTASLPLAPGQVSTLTAYMSQLKHHPPISREEEHALAVRWVEEGDRDAARTMVVSNLRLVVKIAMEYRRAWTNTLDLIQEGNVGLMEAVQRYDPYQGVKLSSYAVYWIRAYILKYILDNMRSVRLGTTRASRKLFFRLNKEKARLEREGYEVSPKLIADRLDVSEDDVLEMENRLSRPDTYLDAPLRRDDGGGATVGETFSNPLQSAESQVGDAELRRTFLEKIEEFAEGLEPRDLQILNERILAEEPRTLADMGEEFDVSRERVRQLEARIVARLREYMQANLVDFEYYAPSQDD